mmetsp:Transcript_49250/g.97418  ORF Transcript_49250/g.97418 Transcript_49250/m.97418 type:complete len:225 (+) Transcript_49250:51-725(+)
MKLDIKILIIGFVCGSVRGLQLNRRHFFVSSTSSALTFATKPVFASDKASFPALSDAQTEAYGKTKMSYPDFTATPSGLQFKEVKSGTGLGAEVGDRIVLSWEGYTIGYYGRPYEKRSGPKGGAFDQEQEYFRFVIGKHTAIPALEEGMVGMKVGGIRQFVISPEIGYPESDRSHDVVGPKPSTFSGQRALDFVLFNQGMIDKTILINVEVKRIDKVGDRGFKG